MELADKVSLPFKTGSRLKRNLAAAVGIATLLSALEAYNRLPSRALRSLRRCAAGMEPDKQLPALVEPPICRPPDCRACTALIAATLEDWSGLPLVTLEASSASSEHWQQPAPGNSLEHL